MNSKEYLMPDGKTAVFEYDHDGVGKITLEAMDTLMGLISAIPSSGRPSGEWIEDPEGDWDDADRGEYECSSCGFRMYPYISDEAFREKYKFCPNCGARMKGADDE